MSYPLTLSALAFFLAVIWGSPLIRFLKNQQMGKRIRIEGPTSHQAKSGTPTMGGILFIAAVVLITIGLNLANLLGFTLIGESVLTPVLAMILSCTRPFFRSDNTRKSANGVNPCNNTSSRCAMISFH